LTKGDKQRIPSVYSTGGKETREGERGKNKYMYNMYMYIYIFAHVRCREVHTYRKYNTWIYEIHTRVKRYTPAVQRITHKYRRYRHITDLVRVQTV
jgi:hypothetical protein